MSERLSTSLLVTLGLAAGWLTACGGEPPARHPLVVIGLDGATWDVAEPMIASGELPALARLRAEGASARLISVSPLSSPVVWTTMASGRFPREHFVLDHTFPFVAGRKRPVQSTVRRVPALWNVASAEGREVAVVNYFASHPPDVVNGVQVSDRAAQGVAGAVFPPTLAERVDQIRQEVEEPQAHHELLARFLPWDYSHGALNDPDDPYHEVSQVVAGRIVNRSAYDETVRRVGLELIARQPDLFVTYFRLIDHASHAAWWYYDPSEFDQPPSDFERQALSDLIPATYRYLDAAIGELIAAAPADANIIVLSDHGFGSGTDEYEISIEGLTGNHRPDGLFAAIGPDVRPGVYEDLTIIDIAPLLLALLDLPIAGNLAAELDERLLRPGYTEDFPPRRVDAYSYSRRTLEADQPIGAEAEEEALQSLKALGYLSADAELAEGPAGEDADFWEVETRLRRRALQGELVFYLLRDDLRRSAGLWRLVAEHDPELTASLSRTVPGEIRRLEDKLGRTVVRAETLESFLEMARQGAEAAAEAPPGEPSRESR